MKDLIISIARDLTPFGVLALGVAVYAYAFSQSPWFKILILPWSMGQAFGGWAR